MHFFRTDKKDNLLWSKILVTSQAESIANSVVSLQDNTFIISGTYIESDTNNTRTNRDCF